jgi:hypothetical protein
MQNGQPQVIIFAEASKALIELCGVSTLERLLRILRRLDFMSATIVSTTGDTIRAALNPPTWARRGLETSVISPSEIKIDSARRVLVLPGDLYCDSRLIAALIASPNSARLIDSSPPARVRPLLRACKRESRGFDSGAAILQPDEYFHANGVSVDAIDAAAVPSYVRGMRRDIRPVFFPAPSAELRPAAEKIIFDTAQNGTLDIPAIIQSPVETWILRGLCRTTITPNQITYLSALLALLAAALFAGGQLAWGMIPALAVGVVDGLDGKQARVKIETTAAGKWEHYLDFVVELAMWAGLAFWFHWSGQLPGAWFFFGMIVVAEIADQLAKTTAQKKIDRLLDDHSPFDRFVRLIGARRDIYLWSLGIGLAVGRAAETYRLCAWWGVITAATHIFRAITITLRGESFSR